MAKGIKRTTEEFIKDAIKIHGTKFDYSEVNYQNNYTDVIIICPIHGKINQQPSSHLKGRGCKFCRSNTEAFIKKAKKVHKGMYAYDKVQYVHSQQNVIIECPIHGSFEQRPANHLAGKGCGLCGNVNRGLLSRGNTEKFIKKAKLKYGELYDYSKTEYITSTLPITVICLEHGAFSITPENHLQGTGCPKCAVHGFNKTKPAYLYYLKITTEDNQILYKIGITNRTVNERFQLKDLQKIEIVKQKLYSSGEDAYNWEQKLLKMYQNYKYKGPDILSSGNTELFTEDIIALWHSGINS